MNRYTWIPLLGVLSLPAACGPQATAPETGAGGADFPADMVMTNVRHVITSEGVRQAVLTGDTAFVQQRSGHTDLRGVHLVFYNESGEESGRLTSRTGEYVSPGGALTARGDAVLILDSEDGERRIESEELHYDPAADQVWSDQPTVMHHQGQVYRGSSFRSDTRFQNVTVQQPRTSGESAPSGGSAGREAVSF